MADTNFTNIQSLLPEQLAPDEAHTLLTGAQPMTLADVLPSNSILHGNLPDQMEPDQATQLMNQIQPDDGLDLNNLPDELTPEQASTLASQVDAHHYFNTGHPVAIAAKTGGVLPANRQAVESQVKQLSDKVFGADQWPAIRTLIMKESGFNPAAQNPKSSAYGIFQFLDSTRNNYGINKDSPLPDQINAGLKYIKDRYGSPTKALAFHLANNYY